MSAYAPTTPLNHKNHLGTLRKIDGENLTSAEDLATQAGLDYTVSLEMPYRCVPEISTDGTMRGTFLPMTNRKGDVPGYWPHAIFRDGKAVAMHQAVGANYTGDAEMEKILDLAMRIQKAKVATVDFAGQYKEYSAVAIQMRFDRETQILGDRYVNWLQIGTSFVGESAFYISMGARRYWCSNERRTINAERVAKRQHRRIEGAWTVDDIVKEISLLTREHDDYFSALTKMHATPLQPGMMQDYVNHLFGHYPDPNAPAYRDASGAFSTRKFESAITRRENKLEDWTRNYRSAANHHIEGTVAGLYEATIQTLQYATDTKGNSKDGAMAAIVGKPSTVNKERVAFAHARNLMTAGV